MSPANCVRPAGRTEPSSQWGPPQRANTAVLPSAPTGGRIVRCSPHRPRFHAHGHVHRYARHPCRGTDRVSDSLCVALKPGPGTPVRCTRPFACTLLGGGVSERPKEHASKACVGVTSPWVQIPPPPPRGPDETRGLGLTKPPEGVPAGAFSGGFAVRGGFRVRDRCFSRWQRRSRSSCVSLTGTTERPPAGGRGLSWGGAGGFAVRWGYASTGGASARSGLPSASRSSKP